MDISHKCREWWGMSAVFPDRQLVPFGNTLQNESNLFLWPALDKVIDRIVTAITHRQFLVVVGSACSCKTTAWNEAKRRLRQFARRVIICQPWGVDPDVFTDQTIYRVLVRSLAGEDEKLCAAREDRAAQARKLLESANKNTNPVVFTVNDAHVCRRHFLLDCKRLWDDLYGFDRLLSVILVGQQPLLIRISNEQEIIQRSEIVKMPSLGDHLVDYLKHECSRCRMQQFPFEDSAVDELAKLWNKDEFAAKDHPLAINNIVSFALDLGWRAKLKTIGAETIVKAIAATGV